MTSTLDEESRLAILHRYALLDTEPEKAIDELAALAARICEMPIVLVSLLDADRQWFKSRIGLEIAETPRAFAFCTHALQHKGMLTVPDAANDARFVDNPLVTGEPGIRFYAGTPLISPEGGALGALCVIDRVPRQLSCAQAEALEIIGRQVMAQFELRRKSLAEVKVCRLRRLYAVSSAINEAIVRVNDPSELYQRACRIAVEQGELTMAWVGLVEADGDLKPVACWGEDNGYVDALQLTVEAERVEGQGPAGVAFRTGEPSYCNDIAAATDSFASRVEAAQRGYKSCAAFPLKLKSRSVGGDGNLRQ